MARVVRSYRYFAHQDKGVSIGRLLKVKQRRYLWKLIVRYRDLYLRVGGVFSKKEEFKQSRKVCHKTSAFLSIFSCFSFGIKHNTKWDTNW